MTTPMLEVTYRNGKPLAAYLRVRAAMVSTTRELAPSLIGDFDDAGALRGIEVLAFDATTLQRLNDELERNGVPRVPDAELAPLKAA